MSLLLAGSIALFSAQQLLGTQTTEAIVENHELRNLESVLTPQSTADLTVTAAAPRGQFEDFVKPTPVPTVAPTPQPTAVPTAAPAAALYESGIASTYGEGDGFEGNLTACGQVFHTVVVQVAHKSLPCGTKVRVEDTTTGRSIDARVTDRGPYIDGRIVDLSWGAFQKLDPTGPGLLHVNLYVLDD